MDCYNLNLKVQASNTRDFEYNLDYVLHYTEVFKHSRENCSRVLNECSIGTAYIEHDYTTYFTNKK